MEEGDNGAQLSPLFVHFRWNGKFGGRGRDKNLEKLSALQSLRLA